MPALIPKAFTQQNHPFVWVCSDCDRLFSSKHLPNGSPPSDTRHINLEFVQHCRRRHPKTVVVGLQTVDDREPKPSLVESILGWVQMVGVVKWGRF